MHHLAPWYANWGIQFEFSEAVRGILKLDFCCVIMELFRCWKFKMPNFDLKSGGNY